MFTSIAAVTAWLRAVRQRFVNAASACWRRARPGVHDAWATFVERVFAAVRQAILDVFDAVAPPFNEASARTPQG